MTRHLVKKGGLTPSRPPLPLPFRPPDGPGDDAGLTLLRIPHSCSPPRPDIRMHIYLHYLQNCKKTPRWPHCRPIAACIALHCPCPSFRAACGPAHPPSSPPAPCMTSRLVRLVILTTSSSPISFPFLPSPLPTAPRPPPPRPPPSPLPSSATPSPAASRAPRATWSATSSPFRTPSSHSSRPPALCSDSWMRNLPTVPP